MDALIWWQIAGVATSLAAVGAGFWRRSADVCYGGAYVAGAVYITGDVLCQHWPWFLIDVGTELLILGFLTWVWLWLRRRQRQLLKELADAKKRLAYLNRAWN